MNTAILLAGGSGKRFGGDKILKCLGAFSVAHFSLSTFSASPDIHRIVLVASRENEPFLRELAKGYPKVSCVTRGGETRFESAKIGFLQTQKDKYDICVFHNMANPFVTDAEISATIAAARVHGAAGVAHTCTSTLRTRNGERIPRKNIFLMETPQAIHKEVFMRGLRHIHNSHIPPEDVTDDLCVAEAAGVSSKILPASPRNRKITFPEDILCANNIIPPAFQFFRKGGDNIRMEDASRISVGIGQDSHLFSHSGTLVLGGISIPDAPKLRANSDGDAVIHALINAISSAYGGGSLSLFADRMCTDGITDSAEYAQVVMEHYMGGKEHDLHRSILHLSVSIEAKKPKLEPHFDRMRKRLSEIFHLPEKHIGLTATTGENMSDCGRGMGICVWASATVRF